MSTNFLLSLFLRGWLQAGMRRGCGLAFVVIISLAASHPVHACACCSESGERNVTIRQLDSDNLGTIRRLRFSKQAELFLTAAGIERVKGISGISESSTGMFDLEVAQQTGRWIFEFRDGKKNAGTLTLNFPNSISVFEIDPRDGTKQPGGGPRLYKEWKLTAKAVGTGIFARGVGSGQNITLVLQGHGNNCTTADDFGHWTIVVYGSKTEYSLFGNLSPASEDAK
jgi:hypothetical protein